MSAGRETSNMPMGTLSVMFVDEMLKKRSIDGALQPWTDELLRILLELFPLPEGLEIIPPDEIPPPRVLLSSVSILDESQDPLKSDLQYHKGVVRTNERITDPSWYQDVRLFKFDVEDDIQ
jgi:hypothetical protein